MGRGENEGDGMQCTRGAMHLSIPHATSTPLLARVPKREELFDLEWDLSARFPCFPVMGTFLGPFSRQERAVRNKAPSLWGVPFLLSVVSSSPSRYRDKCLEMVWRMIRWHPGYTALQKWAPVLNSPTPDPAARKKAVVARARQLAVDLWRVFTGQVEAEKFGLVYQPEAA